MEERVKTKKYFRSPGIYHPEGSPISKHMHCTTPFLSIEDILGDNKSGRFVVGGCRSRLGDTEQNKAKNENASLDQMVDHGAGVVCCDSKCDIRDEDNAHEDNCFPSNSNVSSSNCFSVAIHDTHSDLREENHVKLTGNRTAYSCLLNNSVQETKKPTEWRLSSTKQKQIKQDKLLCCSKGIPQKNMSAPLSQSMTSRSSHPVPTRREKHLLQSSHPHSLSKNTEMTTSTVELEAGHNGNHGEEHNSADILPAPVTDEKSAKIRQRRQRQAYSAFQLSTLEKEFAINRYLTCEKREFLSQSLGLTESQVKAWFQNRRTKRKKQLTQQPCHIRYPRYESPTYYAPEFLTPRLPHLPVPAQPLVTSLPVIQPLAARGTPQLILPGLEAATAAYLTILYKFLLM